MKHHRLFIKDLFIHFPTYLLVYVFDFLDFFSFCFLSFLLERTCSGRDVLRETENKSSGRLTLNL